MNYCTRCLYPENHPLNLVFDEQGVCSGCRVHEEKDSINWTIQAEKLKKILQTFKNTSGNNYDCIIPVSGARDSYFIVHTIKNVYGLNPLLVTYNKQYNTDIGIRNLAYLKTFFNCDCLTLTVAPQTVKKITRATLRRRGSIYWHILAGQTVYPVQVAVKFKIPLIIWGAHQGIDQVGMFSHMDEVEMTRKYRKDHDLMGLEAEDLLHGFDNINKDDIIQYVYPSDKEIEQVGVRGIYLNNYIRWDTKAQHEHMIKMYGYETASQHRTMDTYNDVDCFNYSDLHDYIKFLKFGYGKITDHCTREIRLKRMTREEGLQIVKNYQEIFPKRHELFFKWLGISESSFYFIINQFRDTKVWRKNINFEWDLIDSIVNHVSDQGVDAVRLEKNNDCEFIVTPSKRPRYVDEKYILFGKGFVNPTK